MIAESLKFNTSALIDGKLVESETGKRFQTINPANGQVITDVASCDAADVDKAVRAAARTFEKGIWSSNPAERKCVLLKFADLIEQHGQELAVMESIDSGKPICDTVEGDIPDSDPYGCMEISTDSGSRQLRGCETGEAYQPDTS